ncbi:hypothetical protein TUM19329_01600 [Legionella antarctica]|uniref:Winged helix-turn-helix domain-containing protein n=1 Tax=Legionella antarctica TaxID=2708020 RepID=A0A6F8T035_9GAMM|nr:helix-turn-helix domain-containing protein [Legionella antarctica]BCA93799.1 hypothetical protein TUM19329_01600 [Legionella antarctica]
MEQIKNHPVGQLGNSKLTKQLYGNSSASQRARILKHFESCPQLSTMQARDKYGIMSPAPRIEELRKKGYQISTQRITEIDRNGVPHRMGLYVFIGKKEASHA